MSPAPPPRRTFILRLAGEIFGYVLLFRSAPSPSRPHAASLRNHLLTCLERFASSAREQKVTEDEIELCRLALVAWVDESILSSDWSGVEDWRREPLQLLLFQTVRAGDSFYEKLSTIKSAQPAALEIYFACLALGFEGAFAGEPERRLGVLRQTYEALHNLGRTASTMETEPIAAPAYDWEYNPERARGRPVWPLVSAFAAVVLLTFGVFWLILQRASASLPGG